MLIKIWFSLISTILVASLGVLLFNFKFGNLLHWMSLIAICLAIALSAIMYIEQPHKKEARKIEKIYADFIRKKDRQIEDLHQKSGVLFKTAMKTSEQNVELAELKRKWEAKLAEEKNEAAGRNN